MVKKGIDVPEPPIPRTESAKKLLDEANHVGTCPFEGEGGSRSLIDEIREAEARGIDLIFDEGGGIIGSSPKKAE